MAQSTQRIFFASKASRLRWVLLGLLVAFGFSADFLLERDISKQVRRAWLDACVRSLPLGVCEQRARSHHSGCFEPAYTSMVFTFGRQRWESFELMNYEACMNRVEPPGVSESGSESPTTIGI
jgi:hypothetical protein